MKIKLETINAAIPALQSLAANTNILTFEAMKFRLELKKLEPVIQEIEKYKNELVLKLGTKNPANGQLSISQADANWDEFVKLFVIDYLSNEMDIEFNKCTISYTKTRSLGISVVQINAIEFMVDVKEEEEKK